MNLGKDTDRMPSKRLFFLQVFCLFHIFCLLSLSPACQAQINNLIPSPAHSASPSAPGCARRFGKRLGDGGVGPPEVPHDAPIPPAGRSLLLFPPAPGTPRGYLGQREERLIRDRINKTAQKYRIIFIVLET